MNLSHTHEEIYGVIAKVADKCRERHSWLAEKSHATVGTGVPKRAKAAGVAAGVATVARGAKRGGASGAATAALSAHPAGRAVLIAKNPAPVLKGLLWVLILCCLIAYVFWTYLIPQPLKDAGEMLQKVPENAPAPPGGFWWLPDGLMPGPMGDAMPWDIIPGSVSCSVETPEPPKIRKGLVWAAHDAGTAVRKVSQWEVDGEEINSAIQNVATGFGAMFGALQEGVAGRPNAVEVKAPTPEQMTYLVSTNACNVPCPDSGSSSTPLDALAAALVAEGVTGEEAVTFLAIAGAESNYDLTADNPESSAFGPYQILTRTHNISEMQAADPVFATRKAIELKRQSPKGFAGPWAETFGTGKHLPYVETARAALARPSSASGPCVESEAGVVQVGARTSAPQIEAAIDFALTQRGKPYLWGALPMTPGGEVPESYDCSSLVDSAFLAAGVNLPGRATTSTLINMGQRVTGPPQRGDLVFSNPGHVGIALGGGQMVHAPRTGDVVKVSSHGENPWAVVRLTSATFNA